MFETMEDTCLLLLVYGVELILESVNKYYIISASGWESGIPNNTDWDAFRESVEWSTIHCKDTLQSISPR